jgi:hypothetical protein
LPESCNHGIIFDVLTGVEKYMDNNPPGNSLNVKHFPNLSVQKWKAWRLPVAKVLRVPRYNFLIQPVRSLLFRNEEDRSYLITGLCYRVDEAIDRKIEKFSWVAYAILAILFGSMLRFVMTGAPISAAFAFILMYGIEEGFIPVMLAKMASDFRSEKTIVPFGSIDRISLVSDPGVVLISWNDSGIETGLALGFTREKARLEFDELKKKLGPEVISEVHDSRLLGNPPSKKK